MTLAETPAHRLTDRLGFRLGLVLSMALLPVGLIAVIQSEKVLNEARARSEAALLGETLRAVAPGMRLVRQAQGAAATLSALVPAALATPGGCAMLMQSLVRPDSLIASASYFDATGRAVCVSSNPAPALSPELFARLSGDAPFYLTSVPASAPGLMPLVQAVSAVTDSTGAMTGAMSVVVSQDKLTHAPGAPQHRQGLAIVVFNLDGAVITANRPVDGLQGLLPRGRNLSDLAARGDEIFTGPAMSGEERTFSVVGLVDPGVFALGSWPTRDPSVAALPTLPATAFPALMWVVSLVVAFVAAELLVSRHIRDLRRAITRFARGHRVPTELDMSTAPVEIRDASEAFVKMTHTILRDEAELEHSLHEKEILLREVHHRVKNNLQLIASIISMQMRETSSVEARQLMRAVQDRVISLATVHKDLYLTSDLTEVHADELMPEIVVQVVTLASGAEQEIELHSSFADVALTPDQAVPLALLVAEAVTHARNEASGEGGMPQLTVTMERAEPGMAVLVVAHAIEPSALVEPGHSMRTGLGRQLIDAFAAQLGGSVTFSESQGRHRLELRFPISESARRHEPIPA